MISASLCALRETFIQEHGEESPAVAAVDIFRRMPSQVGPCARSLRVVDLKRSDDKEMVCQSALKELERLFLEEYPAKEDQRRLFNALKLAWRALSE
jgi:hypothetical protein